MTATCQHPVNLGTRNSREVTARAWVRHPLYDAHRRMNSLTTMSVVSSTPYQDLAQGPTILFKLHSIRHDESRRDQCVKTAQGPIMCLLLHTTPRVVSYNKAQGLHVLVIPSPHDVSCRDLEKGQKIVNVTLQQVVSN